MARILALDIGKKRCGIAVTDPLQIITGGLDTVPTSSLLDFLDNYISKENVETIVIGDPRQMNNKPSDSFVYIKPVVEKLRKKFPGINIALVDERFTSKMAQQALIDGGVKKMKRQDKGLVDKVSAVIILQSYMEMVKNLKNKK